MGKSLRLNLLGCSKDLIQEKKTQEKKTSAKQRAGEISWTRPPQGFTYSWWDLIYFSNSPGLYRWCSKKF